MTKRLAKYASLVLVMAATAAVTTACATWWYQPEVPEELLN